MRIDRLDLTAFGPFTDLSLDLSQGRRGLHLLFGPNEAGKSSALRAVRAALFGFAHSGENFRHDYGRLRVGMAVSEPGGRGGGRRLEFVRRKGTKDTLRDADDRDPLPDDALRPFLGNVTESTFDRLFGLTREELARGGDALLAAGGEVAQLLFSAAGGLTRLQAVRDELDAEAGELFRAGGTAKRRINNALRDWGDLHTEVTREQLRPEDYRRGRQELETLRARREELAGRAAAVRDERDRRKARRSLRLLAEGLDRDEARLAELDANAGRDAELIAAAATLRTLSDDAATVRQDAKHRETALAEIAEHEVQARAALTDLTGRADGTPSGAKPHRVDGRDAPRLTAAQRAAVRDAAARHGELRRAAEAAAADLRQARTARESLAARLAELPDVAAPDDLAAALEPARTRLAAGGASSDARSRADRRRRELDRALARLPHWDGTAEALVALDVPGEEAIDRHEQAWRHAAQAVERAEKRLADAADRRTDAAAKLAALTADGDVPDEAALTAARRTRDEVWAAVRAVLTGDADGPDDPAELAARFASSVGDADALADRLRRESARVEEVRAARVAHAEADRQVADRTAARDDAVRDADAVDAGWQSLWPEALRRGTPGGVAPPTEMRRWRAGFESIRDLAADLEDLSRGAEEAGRAARACRDDLAARLTPLLPALGAGGKGIPDGLADTLRWAEKAVDRIEATRRTRAELTDELAAAGVRLASAGEASEEANVALDTWSGWWARVVAPLDLPGTPTAAEATAWLAAYDEAGTSRDRADRTRERIAQIDRRAAAFAESAAGAAARFAPDLGTSPPAEVAESLGERLAAARERSREREKLTAAVREADAEFRALSGGDGGELRRDARAADPAALQREVEELESQLATLDAERDALVREVRDAEHALAALDRSGAAAEAEQRAQAVLAGIADDAERYARLKLADSLLTVAMERHRGRVQEPVLRHARRLFARMTCGEFSDLRVTPGDTPQLIGVRAADGSEPGEEVPPAGMSAGTRDQLYFALRLAGLRVHLDAADPLPLVADDLLESFDDDRAAAALEALADLSEHTQVILLTHHRHLVTLARKRLPRRTLFVHDLVPEPEVVGDDAVPPVAQRSLIEVE